ncbi:MAG: hypothetical protein KDK39_17065 [Leptospiraceae bacterium]|nr:hypothetical protein [Leptospiraceae bacterium]
MNRLQTYYCVVTLCTLRSALAAVLLLAAVFTGCTLPDHLQPEITLQSIAGEKRERIEQGYLTFVLPSAADLKEITDSGFTVWVHIQINGRKHFWGSFDSGEVLKVAIPAGLPSVSYQMSISIERPFNGLLQISHDSYCTNVPAERKLNVKPNQVVSIRLKLNDDEEKDQAQTWIPSFQFLYLDVPFRYPMGNWPVYQRTASVEMQIEDTQLARRTVRRSVVVGRVHTLRANQYVEIITVRPGTIRPGQVLLIGTPARPLAKLTVQQVYHTKVVGRIITSSSPVTSGMPVFRMQ